MATLYITEYTAILDDRVQIPLEPPSAEQAVTISSSHAESAPFASTTRVVRLSTDVICSVLIGNSPAATAASGRMAANQTEYRGVQPGMKVSVITNT